MALKTFNVDDELYKRFSEHCKREGISMSKRVNKFIEQELGRIEGVPKRLEEESKKRRKEILTTVHAPSKYS